jgi:membrane protein
LARPVTGVKRDSSLVGTLRRTLREFSADGMTDWAAALTYYGLLSLFPALLAVSSLVGLFGDPEVINEIITDLAPEDAAQALAGPVDSITENTGAAGLALVIGIGAAMWGASNYTAAFSRAHNVIMETREGRPFWKLRPAQLGITAVNVLLLVCVILALVFSGPVVDAVAGPLGVGDTAVTLWTWLKWPLLVGAAAALLTVLYAATPNVRQRSIAAVVPGALLALAIWALATFGFALYVANLGAYNETYGSLGGVIVLLVWMWISNVAVLLGAEFNAERERARQMAAGVPGAEREIQLPVREEPSPPRTR